MVQYAHPAQGFREIQIPEPTESLAKDVRVLRRESVNLY